MTAQPGQLTVWVGGTAVAKRRSCVVNNGEGCRPIEAAAAVDKAR